MTIESEVLETFLAEIRSGVPVTNRCTRALERLIPRDFSNGMSSVVFQRL